MYKRISKRKIKGYIDFLELELKRLEREGEIMQEENDKSKFLIYDLTEHYLKEEHIRGQIEAAKYILNCC